jgi:hypothetical protein
MKRHATAWVVLIVVLGAALVWYFNASQPVGTHPSAIDLPSEPAVADPREVAEYPIEVVEDEPPPDAAADMAPEPEPLPALEDSDPYMTDALVGVLGADAVAEWFLTEQFISRVVATVDSLTGRQVAPLVLPLKPPGGEFLVTGEEDALFVAPANAARYQVYVELAAGLDTAAVAALYVRYYPLFQQAYEALGYPGGYFNDRLVEVIDHLLAAPTPEWPPQLVKPEAVHLYADERLEALSAGQKLLIRIGPEHGQTVRGRLVELREALTAEAPGRE